MKINKKGLMLIKEFEGCSLKAYRCPAGILTIGYGHTGSDVQENLKITQEEAEKLLKSDLKRFEEGVFKLITIQLNTNQFSALVCFAFNLGLGNLQNSTLLRKVNSNQLEGAGQEFLKWNKAGGKVLAGLTRRREAELSLWQDAPRSRRT